MEPLIRLVQDVSVLMSAALVPAIGMWVIVAWWRGRAGPASSAAMTAAFDVALVLSLVLIGVVGLRPGPGIPGGWEQWNLVPFRDLARAIDGRPWGMEPALAGLAGNLAFFAPWGLASALRLRRLHWWPFFALTVAISAFVEVGQAIMATGRSSDVTDVIMNTTGGLIGYALGRALARPRARPPDSRDAAGEGPVASA